MIGGPGSGRRSHGEDAGLLAALRHALSRRDSKAEKKAEKRASDAFRNRKGKGTGGTA